jgi:hypothetical protein
VKKPAPAREKAAPPRLQIPSRRQSHRTTRCTVPGWRPGSADCKLIAESRITVVNSKQAPAQRGSNARWLGSPSPGLLKHDSAKG